MAENVKIKLTKNVMYGGTHNVAGSTVEVPKGIADQLVNRSLGELVKAEADAPKTDAPKASSDRVYCHVEGCKKYSKLMLCPECEKLACPEHVDNEAGMCVTCVAATEADD